MGGVDVTSTATIPPDQRSVATFGARAAGVVAGLPIAAAVIEAVCGDAASKFVHLVADGDRVDPGTDVARVTAPTRLLLTAERSALNLLCHLSGIATLTRRWADELAGTVARVRDTRKTTPGLRALEKYAVRCGGGVNHRMGLSDMALVKDNHVAAAGGVAAAYALVRALEATIPVEIEVDTLDGLRDAIDAGADEVLLDNFDLETTRAAVAYRDESRAPGAARSQWRSDGRGGPPRGRDGRRLHRRRRADPLGAGARPGARPARPVRRLSCAYTRPTGAPHGPSWAPTVRSPRRVVSPSFVNTLLRWYSTVRGLMNSSLPISEFVWPAAANRAIWASCGVRSASSASRCVRGQSHRLPAARAGRARRTRRRPCRGACRGRREVGHGRRAGGSRAVATRRTPGGHGRGERRSAAPEPLDRLEVERVGCVAGGEQGASASQAAERPVRACRQRPFLETSSASVGRSGAPSAHGGSMSSTRAKPRTPNSSCSTRCGRRPVPRRPGQSVVQHSRRVAGLTNQRPLAPHRRVGDRPPEVVTRACLVTAPRKEPARGVRQRRVASGRGDGAGFVDQGGGSGELSCGDVNAAATGESDRKVSERSHVRRARRTTRVASSSVSTSSHSSPASVQANQNHRMSPASPRSVWRRKCSRASRISGADALYPSVYLIAMPSSNRSTGRAGDGAVGARRAVSATSRTLGWVPNRPAKIAAPSASKYVSRASRSSLPSRRLAASRSSGGASLPRRARRPTGPAAAQLALLSLVERADVCRRDECVGGVEGGRIELGPCCSGAAWIAGRGRLSTSPPAPRRPPRLRHLHGFGRARPNVPGRLRPVVRSRCRVCKMPSAPVGIYITIGHVREHLVNSASISSTSPAVGGRTHQRVTEPHLRIDLDQPVVLRRCSRIRSEPESIGHAPQETSIADWFGGRDQQQTLRPLRQRFDSPDKALLDLPRQRARPRQRETTCQLATGQAAGQFQ